MFAAAQQGEAPSRPRRPAANPLFNVPSPDAPQRRARERSVPRDGARARGHARSGGRGGFPGRRARQQPGLHHRVRTGGRFPRPSAREAGVELVILMEHVTKTYRRAQ